MNPEEATTQPFFTSNRRNIMLGIALIIIVILGVVALFLYGRKSVKTSNSSPITHESNITKAHLYFNPDSVLLTPTDQSETATIMLTTPPNTTAVELNMVYDPQALQDVSVFAPPTTIFGSHSQFYVIGNSVDASQGKIQFSISVLPGVKTLASGTGTVAVIGFTRNPAYTGSSSGIAFLKTTMVTQKGTNSSVLGGVDPLHIDFMH